MARNRPTSACSRSVSETTEADALATFSADRIASAADVEAAVMLPETTSVPSAARLMFRLISAVAEPCWATAAAMAAVLRFTSAMVAVICSKAAATLPVDAWMSAI